MNSRQCRVAVVLAALVSAPLRSSAQTGCSGAVKDLQQQTRALAAEARGMGKAFLVYDGLDVTVDHALTSYGKRFDQLAASKTDSAAPGVKLVRDQQTWQKAVFDWEERLKGWGEGISGFKNCMKNPDCSTLDWIREHEVFNKAFTDWLKSIGDGGFEKVTERVEKASELLKNYTAKVGSTATGAMNTALECMRTDIAQARTADSEGARTAAGRPPATPKEATPVVTKGGGGAVKAAAMLLIIGGGIAGGAAIASKAGGDSAGTSSGSSSSGGSGGGATGMSFVNATITCSFNGVIYNRCDGNISVTVRNSIPAGTALRLAGGGGSWFGVNVTTSAALPGTLSLQFTGITGPGSQACPSPITSLVLTSAGGGTTYATAGGFSISINCR